jgi:DNA-binding NarL/FixJ family response regulator
VAQGLSNKEIAHRLTVSLTTVRAHITKILSKLHLSNRTQAALYALKQGVALLEGAQQPGRVLVSVQA